MDQYGIVVTKTIDVNLAMVLQQNVVEGAILEELSGFVAVYNAAGMLLCSRAVGNPRPQGVRILQAKIETVLARHQSTQIWADHVKAEGIRPEDYAGTMKTMFGGGLAIFYDRKCTEFVGAIAFTGGSSMQDRYICRSAIEQALLFTDDI